MTFGQRLRELRRGKPPVGVLRQRLAQLSEAASKVTHLWDRLARCEDEFYPESPGACDEYQQELDEAILSLMRIADPDLWESRQQMHRAAVADQQTEALGGQSARQESET